MKMRAKGTKSRKKVFFLKKAVLKNFAKLTAKHLSQSLFFNKAGVLRPATLFKKRLWYRYFFIEQLQLLSFKTICKPLGKKWSAKEKNVKKKNSNEIHFKC